MDPVEEDFRNSDQPDEPADQPEPEFLTVAQAAKRLTIATQTLRNAIAEGRIPVTRIYGRVLVKPADVEEYRKRSQHSGPKPGKPKQPEKQD